MRRFQPRIQGLLCPLDVGWQDKTPWGQGWEDSPTLPGVVPTLIPGRLAFSKSPPFQFREGKVSGIKKNLTRRKVCVNNLALPANISE